jgi:hypothetical protein
LSKILKPSCRSFGGGEFSKYEDILNLKEKKTFKNKKLFKPKKNNKKLTF